MIRTSAAARTALVFMCTTLLAAPQLRVDVRLVNIYCTVMDANGRYVSGLKKSDFVVEEDGRRQALAHFAQHQDTPVSVGIVLDTSASMRSKLRTATTAVERFVQTIHQDDDLFLLGFDSNIQLLQDFTSDRTKLRKALRYVEPAGGTALYDALWQSLDKISSGLNSKRAILLITDGEDQNSKASFEQIRERIRAAEVLVYPLGISATPDFTDPFSFNGPPRRDVVNMDVLKTFAWDSGGAAYPISEDMLKGKNSHLDSVLAEIAEDLRSQYTLSYYPTHPDDGQFHRIRVTTRYGYAIRARHGYVATPGR